MTPQSQTTKGAAASKTDPSSSDSHQRKQFVKIKRSSGKYEYVTRERLKQLNKRRRQRAQAKKILKKRLSFVAFIVIALVLVAGSVFLFKQLKGTNLTATELLPKKDSPSSVENQRQIAAGATGAIQVSCDVEEATVYVDGKPLNQTRGKRTIVNGLTAGFHEVTVKKSGFSTSPESIVAHVVADQTTPLKFSLTEVQ